MDTNQSEEQARWRGPFFSVWTGQQLSLIGSSLAQFALVWWVTETTGSATTLASATLVAMLPGIIVGPFVGALVDRWNRRLVMIAADTLVALVAAGVAILFWTDTMRIWHVYIIMLVRSIGGTFHWPAMQASTSLMVPDEHLPRVAGLNQTMQGTLNIVGPPLGALLLGILPLHAIMAIDLVTAAFAISPLFFVDIPQPERAARPTSLTEKPPSVWSDLREGLRYVWSWPGLIAICVLAMLLNFFVVPAFVLMPILVTQHFRGGALQLGWLNSAWGAGLVSGGLVLGVWGGFRRRIVTMLMGIVGLGVGLLLVASAPPSLLTLALVGMLVGGAMNSMCNGSAHALLQQVVRPEMQGRTFTLIGSLCNAMSPLSMAIAGPVADALGIRLLYLVGGVAQTVIGLGAFFVPAIMCLEDSPQALAAKSEARPGPA